MSAAPEGATREVHQQLDPGRSTFIFVCGKKGYGKSQLGKAYFDSYPFDRLVIDPTHDFDAGDDAEVLTDPLPSRWPPPINDKRQTFIYRPDPGSPTYSDDLDRAVGLAFYHKRCLLFVDEIHELTQAGKTRPHFRRVLHQGRHAKLSLIMCGPRPKDIDPLCISQADFVYIFRLPHPLDRERVAQVCGLDPRTFDEAAARLPKYEYLRWDAEPESDDLELLHFPPIPLGKPKDPPVRAD